MKTPNAAFIYSAEMEKYPYPPEHPFNTTRAARTREIVNSMGMLSGTGRTEAAPVIADQITLEKFHSARYILALKRTSDGKFDPNALAMGIGTGDCPAFKGVYEASAWACGASVTGLNLILKGTADFAFNPAGGLHHAHSERASGFCYLNDVAIACMLFAENGKRVLYLDLDAHHGDGVQYAFYDRNDVMTVSFHQDPRTLFPGTGFPHEIGSGSGKGYSVNVPLPIGTYDTVYMKAFKAVALPLIKAYNPDVFVLQLGADGLATDPLANLQLTNNIYADIINLVTTFNKPILATGGGGYHFENTTRAWALAWSALCGADSKSKLRDDPLPISDHQRQAIEAAIDTVIEQVKTNVFTYHSAL